MSSQHILSVDLQELGAAFEAFCEREGLARTARAAFVRNAIKNAIGAEGERPARDFELTRGHGPRKWLRASVSPSAYDVLVQAMQVCGARSLSQYLQWVASHATQLPVRRETKGKTLSPEVMKAITANTSALLALGRNINQIAKSLHLYPGKTTEKERERLRALPALIQQHTESTAKLLLALKPPRARKRESRVE